METEKETEHPGFRVLVVTSTRESAIIISRTISKMGISTHYSTGGMTLNKDLNILDYDHPEVVVGTPGKLSIISQKSDYFKNLKYLVLHDLDMMLNSERSKQQVDAILKDLPVTKETIFLNTSSNIEGITVEEKVEFKQETKLQVVKGENVLEALKKLSSFLKSNPKKKIVVLCPSIPFLNYFKNFLQENEFFCYFSHGGVAPRIRTANFLGFTEVTGGVFLTTSEAPVETDYKIQIGGELKESTNLYFEIKGSKVEKGELLEVKGGDFKVSHQDFCQFALGFVSNLKDFSPQDSFEAFINLFKDFGFDKKEFLKLCFKDQDFFKLVKKLNPELLKIFEKENIIPH